MTKANEEDRRVSQQKWDTEIKIRIKVHNVQRIIKTPHFRNINWKQSFIFKLIFAHRGFFNKQLLQQTPWGKKSRLLSSFEARRRRRRRRSFDSRWYIEELSFRRHFLQTAPVPSSKRSYSQVQCQMLEVTLKAKMPMETKHFIT